MGGYLKWALLSACVGVLAGIAVTLLGQRPGNVAAGYVLQQYPREVTHTVSSPEQVEVWDPVASAASTLLSSEGDVDAAMELAEEEGLNEAQRSGIKSLVIDHIVRQWNYADSAFGPGPYYGPAPLPAPYYEPAPPPGEPSANSDAPSEADTQMAPADVVPAPVPGGDVAGEAAPEPELPDAEQVIEIARSIEEATTRAHAYARIYAAKERLTAEQSKAVLAELIAASNAANAASSWFAFWPVLLGLVAAGIGIFLKALINEIAKATASGVIQAVRSQPGAPPAVTPKRQTTPTPKPPEKPLVQTTG